MGEFVKYQDVALPTRLEAKLARLTVDLNETRDQQAHMASANIALHRKLDAAEIEHQRLTAERDQAWEAFGQTAWKLQAELTALKASLGKLEEEMHEAGCPTIADDESDEVLADYQQCTCPQHIREWREWLAALCTEHAYVSRYIFDPVNDVTCPDCKQVCILHTGGSRPGWWCSNCCRVLTVERVAFCAGRVLDAQQPANKQLTAVSHTSTKTTGENEGK